MPKITTKAELVAAMESDYAALQMQLDSMSERAINILKKHSKNIDKRK